jgi:hypothetical protein
MCLGNLLHRNRFFPILVLSLAIALALCLPSRPTMAGLLEEDKPLDQPTLAPIITSTPVTSVTVGGSYSYAVKASGTPAPTFQLTAAPPGMTINASTGVISWAPNAVQSHTVTVLATNGNGTASQSFIVRATKPLNRNLCPANMDAYWTLEEISGSPVFSDIYSENHASCKGNDCPVVANGRAGEAQYFDGNKQLTVNASSDFAWGNTSSFSIELWASTKQNCTGNSVFIGKARGGGSNSSWWLGCSSGGKATFLLRDSDNKVEVLYSQNSISDGNWHHIVAGRDSTTQQIYLYVNGQLDSSHEVDYTGGFSGPMPIGIGHFGLSYYYVGFLDEIAVYSRMLMQSEVQSHYQAGLGGTGYCSSPSDLSSPVITSTPVTKAVTGQPYSYQVRANGNPVPTFELIAKPEGMTMDGTKGIISWFPSEGGNYDVTVKATNSLGSINQNFSIEVTQVAEAPVFTSTPVTTAVAGQQYRYDVHASGNPAPTYQLKNEPSGMSIDVNGGTITWIPSEAGSYDITVEATNVAATRSQEFTIIVQEAERVPIITSTPVARAVLKELYSYQVEATGHPTPTLALVAAPTGMTLDVETGLISWLPETSGSSEVTIEAVNSAGSGRQSFTILVDVPVWLPAVFNR